MLEEVLPNIYRIEIPLPQNPLGTLNSYLIKGQGRFLLIDTGMDRKECMQAISVGLQRLGVDLEKTDVFITHMHIDHMGLVTSLATSKSEVYCSQWEPFRNNSGKYEERWRELCAVMKSHGFPEDELEKALENHPARRYILNKHIDFCTLIEGDTVDIGDYSFRCIETPGHTPGHMCLYEADKRILVSGDHILSEVTPNIAFWLEMEDSLKEYLASLEKVYGLDVDTVLPGHREVFHNHRRRIRELQEHHRVRANEIISALRQGEKNAFQIAPHITWDVDFSSWQLFPPAQKWFAMGETIAHLRYLEGERMIHRRSTEQAEGAGVSNLRYSFYLTDDDLEMT